MNSRREAELLEIIERQSSEIQRLGSVLQQQALRHASELQKRDQTIKILEGKLDHLVRRIFGSSSEKMDPNQFQLEMEGLMGKEEPSGSNQGMMSEGEESKEEKARKEPREKRPRLPEHLPVEEERIEPLEVQADPTQWKQIGEEVTEQLDYRPAVYVRRRIVRPKYVSVANRELAPLIAPLPPMLQERCLAAPGMLAQVVVAKYADHLPLYRQEQILQGRHGIPISRQTLDGWVILAAYWVRPIYEVLKTTVMEDGYVQLDETPVRFLDPGNGKTRLGYLWTMSRPGRGTVYHWHPGRGLEGLEEFVPAGILKVIQCDGYAVYGAYARAQEVVLAGCWAHVRRKFFEAQEEDWRMVWVLKQIGKLYQVEAELRKEQAGPALREAVRQWKSRPVIKRIQRVLAAWKEKRRFLPKSGAGEALEYTLNLGMQLEVYLADGRIEIDNNLVENAIRPTAVGKKNWLFIGAEDAGQTSAILYTIIEECRRLAINPQTYLTEVLKRLPTATNHMVHTLTPAALSPYLTGVQSQSEKAA